MDFLKNYKEYTDPLEVPDIFHVWCALSCIAAAAQRKIWLDLGLVKLAPNLYIILNSAPGKCGKDTAMNIVRDMLTEIKDVQTKSDSITKEKIFQEMMAVCRPFELGNGRRIMHSSLTIFATEMSLLIKRGDKDFVSALNALFNTMSTFKHSTKGSGESILINPYLNILGGTTPDWIGSNIQDDILEGGLSARCLIIHSDTPKPPNPFPDVTEAGRVAYYNITKRVERICQIGGIFTMDAKAKELYKEWYMSHHRTENSPKDYRMHGYHFRKRVHLLKISMLLSLAKKDDLVLLSEDIQGALNLLELTEPALAKSLRGVGRNELNSLSQMVLSLIKDSKELSMEELVANTFNQMNTQELQEVLRALTAMNAIEMGISDRTKKMSVKYVEPKVLTTGGMM